MPRKPFSTATLNTVTTDAADSSATNPTLPPPPSSIPTTFSDSLPLPTLMVFDLDYTLWPFWVDTHVSSPLKPISKDTGFNTAMRDRTGESFSFYPEVPGLLYEMRRRGIIMGLASRSSAPDLANVLLRGISIPAPPHHSKKEAESQPKTDADKEQDKPTRALDFFAYREIYPGSKIRHFKSIQQSTRKLKLANREVGPNGVPFDEMLFFDDESRNREVERDLGVTFCLVRDGVTKDEVDRGVWEWRKRRGITKNDVGKKLDVNGKTANELDSDSDS